jgi:hypothetical protein
MGRAGRGERPLGAAPQLIGDVSVLRRLDEQKVGRPVHRAPPGREPRSLST